MKQSTVSVVHSECLRGYNRDAVRREMGALLRRLGLESNPERGPLSGLIKPGDVVVLKPNWVRADHEHKPGEWDYVVTHPVVIEVAAEFAIAALSNRGAVTILDAPQTDSSFTQLSKNCGFSALLTRLRQRAGDVTVDLIDIREEEWVSNDGIVTDRVTLPGDPLGACFVALDEASEFVGYSGEGKLYGASFDVAETNEAHKGTTHHYLVSRSVLSADVVVNLPKLKTHKKGGITCSLKNMVGMNCRKNWLPHHTQGTLSEGGDQFPAGSAKQTMESKLGWWLKPLLHRNLFLAKALVPLKAVARWFFGDTLQVVRSGNWYGNRTVWRMVLDLNKVLMYADGSGALSRPQPRRYVSIVDGILGGDRNGPMSPDRVESNILIAGVNPVAVDCAAAKLMGFDFRKIPSCIEAFAIKRLPLVDFAPQDITLVSDDMRLTGRIDAVDTRHLYKFRPHFGWKNHIEDSVPGTRDNPAS